MKTMAAELQRLREVVSRPFNVHTKAPYLWPGSKWLTWPLVLPLYPVHTHFIDLFTGTSPAFWLKPAEWTPGMELLNDLNSDIAGFLWCLQDLPEEWFETDVVRPHITPRRSTWKGGTFERFLHWWNRLPHGSHLFYNNMRRLYRDRKVWMSLPLPQRSALWVWANRVRFCGVWYRRDMGIYVGGWRSDCRSGGYKISRSSFTDPESDSYNQSPENWEWYHQRICTPHVEVKCRDACDIIRDFNRKGVLWTLDPPYTGAQRLYPGMQESIDELNERLTLNFEAIKGYLIASVRLWPSLEDLIKRERWLVVPTGKRTSLSSNQEPGREFGEVLVLNYDPREVARCCEIPLMPKNTQTTLFPVKTE